MRDIMVNEVRYQWKFRGSRGERDDICHSAITIFSEDRQTKAIIHFRTIDTFTAGSPLNEGMPMQKDGVCHMVNLNRPKYTAELIAYLGEQGFDFQKRSTQEFDGNSILLDLGYEDIDHYLR